jgi:hypothetical protein
MIVDTCSMSPEEAAELIVAHVLADAPGSLEKRL